LERLHKYRANHNTGWFGPGVFSNYESFLIIDRNKPISGAGRIRFVSPKIFGDYIFSDTNNEDGVYEEKSFRIAKELVLYDALDQVVVEVRDAVTAVLVHHNGHTETYEVFNESGDTLPNRLKGRLKALSDRNGNSITLSYQFAVDATDVELGYDRSKLWMVDEVSDAYGRTMTLHYDLSAKIGDKYVVDSIDVPVGSGT